MRFERLQEEAATAKQLLTRRKSKRLERGGVGGAPSKGKSELTFLLSCTEFFVVNNSAVLHRAAPMLILVFLFLNLLRPSLALCFLEIMVMKMDGTAIHIRCPQDKYTTTEVRLHLACDVHMTIGLAILL
jgi:hypothetical protein